MSYYKRIAGPRVFLSPVDGTDYIKCTSWMNDINSAIRIGMAHRSTNELAERSYLESKKDDDHFFGIVLQDTNELIGTCGLLDLSLLHRTATVGILIGEDEIQELRSWN